MKNSKKGFAIPLIIAIIAVLAIGGAYFYTKKVKAPTTTPAEQNQNQNKNLVGNDKDAHGCIGSAGYSWCEVKNKCLRTWEEKCEATTTNIKAPTIDQTVGWKTYTDNQYGFSVDYPSDWKINDQSYTYNGQKNASLEIESPSRNDIPGYESMGAKYSIQFSLNGKVSVDWQGFIKAYSSGDQDVVRIDLSQSVLKQYDEYSIAKNIIASAKLIPSTSSIK